MPFPIDWRDESENGARFVNSTPTFPLSGTYALLGESDGTEWDVEFPGFRKSASIYLHPMHNRGFSDGKIRTLIRRNTSFSPDAWAGIFFLSDRLGIGTRLDPGQNRYEVSDEGDGLIKIIKVENAIKTTLASAAFFTFFPDTIFGLEVMWEFDIDLARTLITVKIGGSLDFSDLTTLMTYSDMTDPHQFSMSEGFFFQANSHDDFISFNFDKTTISRFIHI